MSAAPDTASLDTQAVLLLTAPLLVGRRAEGLKPLNARDYQRIADHLRDAGRRPGDLLGSGSEELRAACATLVGAERLDGLLRRGMLLSQALDRWATRGIWVVSRADAEYPRRLLTTLGTAAPPILYGAGDLSLLSRPALGVVGSRRAPDVALAAAAEAGAGAARIGALLVSGNAQGIDRSAMQAAADADGVVVSVLADGLEKQVLVPENREALHDDRLVVVSPFDPGVGRTIGLLMGRNKVIYGLSDAVLVADTKHGEGGTWSGAHEHLTQGRPGTVYIRVDTPPSSGQDALLDLGGQVWPEAYDDDGLRAILAPRDPAAPEPSAAPRAIPEPATASEQLSIFTVDTEK
jgi:predicted Rossmann fold nucleotide-binding protein DprA/Smf involved in DNA uptake